MASAVATAMPSMSDSGAKGWGSDSSELATSLSTEVNPDDMSDTLRAHRRKLLSALSDMQAGLLQGPEGTDGKSVGFGIHSSLRDTVMEMEAYTDNLNAIGDFIEVQSRRLEELEQRRSEHPSAAGNVSWGEHGGHSELREMGSRLQRKDAAISQLQRRVAELSQELADVRMSTLLNTCAEVIKQSEATAAVRAQQEGMPQQPCGSSEFQLQISQLEAAGCQADAEMNACIESATKAAQWTKNFASLYKRATPVGKGTPARMAEDGRDLVGCEGFRMSPINPMFLDGISPDIYADADQDEDEDQGPPEKVQATTMILTPIQSKRTVSEGDKMEDGAAPLPPVIQEVHVYACAKKGGLYFGASKTQQQEALHTSISSESNGPRPLLAPSSIAELTDRPCAEAVGEIDMSALSSISGSSTKMPVDDDCSPRLSTNPAYDLDHSTASSEADTVNHPELMAAIPCVEMPAAECNHSWAEPGLVQERVHQLEEHLREARHATDRFVQPSAEVHSEEDGQGSEGLILAAVSGDDISTGPPSDAMVTATSCPPADRQNGHIHSGSCVEDMQTADAKQQHFSGIEEKGQHPSSSSRADPQMATSYSQAHLWEGVSPASLTAEASKIVLGRLHAENISLRETQATQCEVIRTAEEHVAHLQATVELLKGQMAASERACSSGLASLHDPNAIQSASSHQQNTPQRQLKMVSYAAVAGGTTPRASGSVSNSASHMQELQLKLQQQCQQREQAQAEAQRLQKKLEHTLKAEQAIVNQMASDMVIKERERLKTKATLEEASHLLLKSQKECQLLRTQLKLFTSSSLRLP